MCLNQSRLILKWFWDNQCEWIWVPLTTAERCESHGAKAVFPLCDAKCSGLQTAEKSPVSYSFKNPLRQRNHLGHSCPPNPAADWRYSNCQNESGFYWPQEQYNHPTVPGSLQHSGPLHAHYWHLYQQQQPYVASFDWSIPPHKSSSATIHYENVSRIVISYHILHVYLSVGCCSLRVEHILDAKFLPSAGDIFGARKPFIVQQDGAPWPYCHEMYYMVQGEQCGAVGLAW